MADGSKLVRSIFPQLAPIRKAGNLKCPDCAKVMTPYTCEDVVVDKCRECSGIWFDHEEFGVFKRTLDTMDLSQILNISHPPDPEALHISSCPRCRRWLSEVDYSYKSDVKIKKCDRCRGLWLPIHDALNLIELAKISQAIAPEARELARESKLVARQIEFHRSLQETGGVFRTRMGYGFFALWRIYLLTPLYDDNPREAFPLATVGLIGLNVLIFLMMPRDAGSLVALYQEYALRPGEVMRLNSLVTLVTSMFMHAGVMHLLGNMFFLWTFGDNLEDKMGAPKYLLFYLACGLAASFAQILSDPSSQVPILGASGAISGVMGAYFYMFPQIKVKALVAGHIVDLPAWVFLGFWIFMQFLWAVIYTSIPGSGVAWWAHVGGFVAGALLAAVSERSAKAQTTT